MPWNETSGKCYRDYYSLSYEDARHIPTYFSQESNIYWIDSRVKVFPIGMFFTEISDPAHLTAAICIVGQ